MTSVKELKLDGYALIGCDKRLELHNFCGIENSFQYEKNSVLEDFEYKLSMIVGARE